MKVQKIVIIIVSLFAACFAHGQYWYGPSPSGPSGAPWPAQMGPYFRFFMGPTFFQDSELTQFSIGALNNPTGNVRYNTGFSGDFAFGWAFNRYVSLDFETGYIWARMDSVDNYFANNSDMANVPFVVNATFSYPIPHSSIVPYIGGGGGGSDSIFYADSFTAQNGPLGPQPLVGATFAQGSESEVVWAYQAFAGVRFMLNPNMSVGFGYRYFATGDPTFSYPPGPPLNISFKGVRTHTVMFTFQANF